MSHPAGTAKVGSHSMQAIGAALLHDSNHASGSVTVLSRQSSGDHSHFFYRVLGGLGIRSNTALWVVAQHAVFKYGRSRRALARDVKPAQRSSVGVTVHSHARH